MPTIRSRGVPLHYQRVGKGPEVVLVHGLTGNLAFWYPTIVTGLASDYCVTALDLRGHGYSGMSSTGYTTCDLARDLEALFEHLSIQRAHIMGHSYGGAVALHFAVLQPTRVASLTLADVRIRSLQPGQGVHDWAHWRLLRKQCAENGIELPGEGPNWDFRLLEELARRRLDGNTGKLTAGRFPLPVFGNRRRAKQWLKLVGETSAVHDFQDIAGLTPEEIRKAVQPTLAIYGELSHCLPSLQALVKILPDCTAVLVKGVGHFHPLVRPNFFLRRVRHFLKRVERTTVQTPLSALSRF